MTQFIKELPAPLYRDPIFDGATDPTVIWNEQEGCWWMLYTQRRSTEISIGFSNIHGSKIGVASSKDGAEWLYRGTLSGLEIAPGHNTFWAPEVLCHQGTYHMYVSYITGIPTDWDYPRQILHYTSQNLWDWQFESVLPLSSGRVIDACVYEVAPGRWKMWYKDEDHESRSYSAYSDDLYRWTAGGPEVSDCAHEGPNVFRLGGKYWMITDFWQGLGVYFTEDFEHWTRQRENLLDGPGTRPMDDNIGHHADVVTDGEEAVLFYFVHSSAQQKGCTAVQAVRLFVEDGVLRALRPE